MNTWQLEYSFFSVFHCYLRLWHWCQLVEEMLVDWNDLQGKGLPRHRDREGHVRYINILTWLRGFQGKLLYSVLLSLYSSLFCEKLKKIAILTRKPRSHVRSMGY